MRNKRGNILSGASFELIIGVSVAVLIIVLMAELFAPAFFEGNEISESYFERMKDAVALADDDKVGDFFILDNGDDELDFSLVYFGKKESVPSGKTFSFDSKVTRKAENKICVCHSSSKISSCRNCVNLDFPADSNVAKSADYWIIGEGSRIKVEKIQGRYSFYVE